MQCKKTEGEEESQWQCVHCYTWLTSEDHRALYNDLRRSKYVNSFQGGYQDLLFTTDMITSVDGVERYQSGFVKLHALKVLEQKNTP